MELPRALQVERRGVSLGDKALSYRVDSLQLRPGLLVCVHHPPPVQDSFTDRGAQHILLPSHFNFGLPSVTFLRLSSRVLHPLVDCSTFVFPGNRA